MSGDGRTAASAQGGAALRGLPEPLPPGEELLWQGAPDWRALARRAFHVRALVAYFAVLVAWSGVTALYDGQPAAAAALAMLRPAALAVAALGLVALLAWLTARTTVYTITSRRVVLRIGIALPLTVNLPFRNVGAAALRAYRDGTGDIPLSLVGDGRVALLHLWPHARPWRVAKAEPMLRAVPDAARVAEILGRALAAATTPAARPAPESANNVPSSGVAAKLSARRPESLAA